MTEVGKVAQALRKNFPFPDPPDNYDSWEQLTPYEQERWMILARAAIAAMPPQGWQPIETAPKDGTEILIGEHVPSATYNGGWFFRVVYWNKNANDWSWPWNPTVWMPLPEEPK